VTPRTAVGEWFLVSDLHLDGRPSPRDVDRALPAFLETVVRGRDVARAGRGRRALVLLGDTFELAGPAPLAPTRVADRLTALARCHDRVFSALAACVRDGVELHVVGGNHDLEIVRPDASALLNRLLGLEPERPGTRFWPWLLHEPGVLYAEHGSQHHALNRSPAVLVAREAAWTDGPLPPPPLAAASAGTDWCRPADPRAVRVARAFRAASRQERYAAGPAYRQLLDREAVDLRLPPQAAADLAALSRFRTVPAVAGAAGRVLARRTGRGRPGSHLVSRAAEAHRVLEGHRTPAAAYVFGHTHRAEQRPLPGSRVPTAYLNTGTWCAAVRGDGPDRADPGLFPFVRVTATGDGVRAGLHFWSPDDRGVLADDAEYVLPAARSRVSPGRGPS